MAKRTAQRLPRWEIYEFRKKASYILPVDGLETQADAIKAAIDKVRDRRSSSPTAAVGAARERIERHQADSVIAC